MQATEAADAVSRTCIVTGATGGIGRACVRHLLASGHEVLATGRSERALEALLSESQAGGKLRATPLDVTDRSRVRATFAEEPFDVFVDCAGICGQARLDEDSADEVWDDVIGVNLQGAYNCLSAAARTIRAGGSIVLVASGLAKNARAAYGAYCASKHAVLGLTKCAALELAPQQVRVNAVCPGWVDTPMSRADLAVSARRRGITDKQLRSEAVADIPLQRMVAPDDVAELIAFLSSSRASGITGQAYNISCGEFSS